MRTHDRTASEPGECETIDCDFCEQTMCEFFTDVDASRLIRSAVIQHFTWCPRRPADFAGRVVRIYADVVVEAHRRIREHRDRRRHPAT